MRRTGDTPWFVHGVAHLTLRCPLPSRHYSRIFSPAVSLSPPLRRHRRLLQVSKWQQGRAESWGQAGGVAGVLLHLRRRIACTSCMCSALAAHAGLEGGPWVRMRELGGCKRGKGQVRRQRSQPRGALPNLAMRLALGQGFRWAVHGGLVVLGARGRRGGLMHTRAATVPLPIHTPCAPNPANLAHPADMWPRCNCGLRANRWEVRRKGLAHPVGT